ncbi:MAG: hypothetical protein II126_05235 [Erysipelotrichaceae bacterium]|nr:hypothetical protein [Erysipelotrichaceae bacterium]
MNIKKGISYVAFGFLFTLVNFNINFPNVSINIMPDFIGWLLFFLAFDKLGEYIADKPYLKWTSLVLMILSAAIWLEAFVRTGADLNILKTAITVVSGIYMFILFGVLEKIAEDYGSAQKSALGFLKYFNVILSLGFVILAVAGGKTENGLLLLLAATIGLVAIVAVIVTAVILFRLNSEIQDL